MVEHQSGMLSKTSEEGEVVDDIMSLEELQEVLENAPTTNDLAQEVADAVEEIPPVVLGDEETGTPSDVGMPYEDDHADDPVEYVLPDLDTEDWMSKLNEDEIFNSKDGPRPRLHGLRRLAKPYIQSEESKVNALIVVPKEHIQSVQTMNGGNDVMSQTEVIGTYNFPMASVTFNITLVDGRTFSDSADAFYSNCQELALFPTAVASARAEARCLRKVLGIKQHAAEEIVDKDAGEELAPDDSSPIKPEQAKLIDKQLKSLPDVTLKDLIEGITIREDVFSVEELSTGEARKALRVLNDLKKKAKKKGGKKS